jgi:hypothetical protein
MLINASVNNGFTAFIPVSGAKKSRGNYHGNKSQFHINDSVIEISFLPIQNHSELNLLLR